MLRLYLCGRPNKVAVRVFPLSCQKHPYIAAVLYTCGNKRKKSNGSSFGKIGACVNCLIWRKSKTTHFERATKCNFWREMPSHKYKNREFLSFYMMYNSHIHQVNKSYFEKNILIYNYKSNRKILIAFSNGQVYMSLSYCHVYAIRQYT